VDGQAAMSAQPVQEHDPDDPVEILRALPARFHDQFREAVRSGSLEGSVPIEDVIPDWPDRLNRQ
jgi:hypothetical protein